MVYFDNKLAKTEGWSIFECFGSDHGKWQLQKYDEAEVFASDPEAWAHVVDRADAGSIYHKQAIQFLAQHNPEEKERIMHAVYEMEVGL